MTLHFHNITCSRTLTMTMSMKDAMGSKISAASLKVWLCETMLSLSCDLPASVVSVHCHS